MKATSQRGERSFGLSVGTVCALLAAVSLWRGREIPALIGGCLALGLLVPAVIRPSALRIPSALWWRFAQALGWFNARVLLSAVFFLVATPLGLGLRLAGWDPLRLRNRVRGSGWTPYPERMRDVKHYEHLY